MKGQCSGKRILWIDDDYQHLKDLVYPLERDGCRVEGVITLNGLKEKLARRHDYDAYIVDLLLPRGDGKPMSLEPSPASNGMEAIATIRQHAGPHVPILVLSIVKEDVTIKRQLEDFGVPATLEKGVFLPSELKRRVLGAIGESA